MLSFSLILYFSNLSLLSSLLLDSFSSASFFYSTVCPSVTQFLPPLDELSTWSRIINHGNIIQSSGCVRCWASQLSCLVIQCDPVRGQRSRCDCRPLANSALLQERRETEQQLLVKTLFIQGDLTDLWPTSCPHVWTGSRPVEPVHCGPSHAAASVSLMPPWRMWFPTQHGQYETKKLSSSQY